MSYQFTAGRFKGWASDNTPLAGGRLYTYSSGTTTHKAAYTDATLGAACTYVSDGVGGLYIALDSKGEAQLWLGSGAYTFKLTDSSGSTVWTVDGVRDQQDASRDYTDALRNDLSASSGSSLVGFIQSGAGAVARTNQDKMRDTVSAFDFMTSAQIADVKSGAATLDVTSAIQAAINYAATRASVGGAVYLPPGSYKTTSTIYTYGSGGIGQVALIGSGVFSTRIIPAGDFTVINLVTSYSESGGFSIEWPVTAAASIPATRVGIELAGANWQFSYATLKNVTVNYGYRGFVLNDWAGQPLGTAYLCTLQQLTAFRCSDWGFYLNSKTGSTTLRMLHCYVRGDNSSGGAQYGKGVYANNFNDIYAEQLAIDQCLDSWAHFLNYNVAVINGSALESNKIASASATAVLLQGSQTVVNGFKDISCAYDTGGNARVIFCGASCILSLSGYSEQFSTVAGGTTKYRIAFNSSGTDVSIVDRSVLPSHVLDNGWYHSAVYQGVRLSRTGSAPSYGTWLRGDYVKNGAPAAGQPKGWFCTASGSPGTWVSEGNL